MCDCFKKLAKQARKQAEREYIGREILEIEVGQGINRQLETKGYVSVMAVIKSPTGKGRYKRCIGYKPGFKSLNSDWKYCPLCGKKL